MDAENKKKEAREKRNRKGMRKRAKNKGKYI